MKFSFTGGRAYTDFAQGLGVAELPKENAHKLDPVVEAQGESLGTVLRSAVSNSRRESRICEKVFVTRVKPPPPELDELVLPEPIRNSDRCSAIFTSRIETLIGQG